MKDFDVAVMQEKDPPLFYFLLSFLCVFILSSIFVKIPLIEIQMERFVAPFIDLAGQAVTAGLFAAAAFYFSVRAFKGD